MSRSIPRGGGGESEVAALVKSISKHKNFRQLASYSVKCLQKVITPPHQGWETNLKEAFDTGALEAITQVLKKHSGDEEVLTAATGCLSSLATNPHYAGKLVESGAMVEMINSVTSNPTAESGVAETIELMEVVATNNPEALLKHGGTTALKGLLDASQKHQPIFAAAMRSLEQINKVPGGAAEIIKEGALKTILDSTALDSSEDEENDHLEPAFRMLDRMCRVPEQAEEVRKADGMQVLLAALDKHKDKSKVCKVGGRLLSKLASGNVKGLIEQMEAATNPREKEFLAQLLSNLALEEDNAEKIVKNGGIPTLLKTFEGASEKTVEGSARALARIAAQEEFIGQLVEAGAVQTLVKTIGDNASNPAVAAAVTPTLLNLASREEYVDEITKHGGVEAILSSLREHPEAEDHAKAALRFLENLGTLDFDLQQLVDGGAIPIIVSAMKALPAVDEVQLNGTRALIYMSSTVDNLAKSMAAGLAQVLLNYLKRDKRDKKVVLVVMYMLTTIALVDGHKETLKSLGGVDTVLGAIAEYAGDDAVTEAARELVEVFLDAAAVSAVVGDIGTALQDLLAKPNKAKAQALIKAVGKAGAFSIVQANAEHMVRSEGVRSLVAALEQVAMATKLPGQEDILRACSTTLMQISDSVSKSEELRTMLGKAGAVKAVITSVKQHPKLIDNVTSGVAFLESYAQIPECAALIAAEGGIEACAGAMRANATDVAVITSAVNTLLALGSTDKGAVAVARHGGTKQVIATVTANTNTPDFAKPMEAMLTLLQRVAMTSEGAEVLVKQGGVDAVIDAADSLGNDPRVAQGSSRVLARLLTREDVATAVARLNEVAGSVTKGRIPSLEELKPVVSRVGHMSLVGGNAADIVAAGGARSLVGIIGKLVELEDAEVKGAILPVAIQALANLAVRAEVDPALGAAAMLSQAISEGVAVPECLECIKTLGKDESNAVTMCSGACVGAIVDTLRANMRNQDMAASCFSALASLAAHSTTVDAVAGTAAVRLASDWLDDNLDDSKPDAAEPALRLLAAVAASPTHAEALMTGGIVHIIKSALSKVMTGDADEAAPTVLTESLHLVRGLCMSSPAAMAELETAGTFKRVIRAVSSNAAYIKSASSMTACIDLLETCAKDREVATGLLNQGADEMIVAAMNANGNNQAMLVAGARAMSALGCGAEAGLMALDDVKALSAAIEAATDVDEATVSELGEAVQRLSSLMMVEGIVTADNAHEMMTVLNDSLARLADSEMASPEILAAGVQAIGRLSSMEVVAVEEEAMSAAVEMVMDVLQMHEDSEVIRESAIHTIGNMASGAAAIKVMAQQGCMAVITAAAKGAPADAQLQSVVSSTLQKITVQAERSAAELVKAGDGAEALASVIEANAQDEHMLASCVESIIAVDGGEEALWEVLDNDSGNADMSSEMLRVLSARATSSSEVTSVSATPKRVQGLVKSLSGAMAQTAEQTASGTADARAQGKAVKMVDNSVLLLTSMTLDAVSCEALAEAGGVEAIVSLIGQRSEDAETTARLVSVLTSVTAQSISSHKALVASSGGIAQVVSVLRANVDNPAIVAETLQVLSAVCASQGAAEVGLDREALRAIQAAQAAHTSDATIAASSASLVAALSAVFSDEPARMMAASLEAGVGALQSANTVQAHVAEDGRTYFVNTVTNETTWEAPAEYAALTRSLTDMATAAASQQEDNIADVPEATLGAVVSAMETHAGDAALAKSAVDTLNTLSINESNCEAIARNGGVKAIITAINRHPDAVELLRSLLILLEKISRNDFFKEQIAAEGGVPVIVGIIHRHVAQEPIAIKCLSTLANLAFNSAANIQRIMDAEGVTAVEKAMQTYPGSPRLLENAMCTLSNLMYGSDDNKKVIGQTCGDEIVNIVRVHFADVNLFKMALRALGNLSYCDENIRFVVVDHHATACIVEGMQTHDRDAESLQLAMEVLGNFASLEEDEDVEETVAGVMYREGGPAEIIKVMRAHDFNTGILKSGMDALSNVANDPETTENMARELSLIALVVSVMQSHEWDGELISHAMPLLTTLTYTAECSKMLATMEGIQVILDALESHGDNDELLHSAQAALTNLAPLAEARTVIANIDGMKIILGLLATHIDKKAFVTEVLGTLTRLCGDDALSVQIADGGMHLIMPCINKYQSDPEFLTYAFRLLGHLAFVTENLKTIVQHNGIKVIMKAICAHPDDKDLMVRSIQTIDNIAMANKEHAQLVIEEGGRELIERIMDEYSHDEEICRHGKSAVLSMSALENLSKTADMGTRGGAGGAPPKPAAPVVEEKEVDPLAKYRNFLSAGSVITLWTKGSGKSVHVLVSPDWRSIVWQDPKKSKKLGAMDLRSISGVTKGMADGHKKKAFSRAKCDPDCAFSVVGERSSLDLETVARPDVDKWCTALNTLLTVFRTNPSMLG